MRIGCVLMAAGNSARFGENKLLAEYRGKTLLHRALEAIPVHELHRVVVVTQYDAVENIAREFGLETVRNNAPELGISHTIQLGTAALAKDCDGILYQVADQPLLQQATVKRILTAFCARPDRIVVPVAGDRRGNPCIFPAEFFPQLAALEGDRGGSQIIKKHPDRILNVEVPARELYDVDTAEALTAIDA